MLFSGANLQKKWRHLKDSFCREKRRISEAKSGAAADRKTPYVYYNILSFLNKGTPPVMTQSSIDRQDPDDLQEPTENIDSATEPYQSRVVSKKRKPVDEVGKQLINVLKSSSEEQKQFEKEVLDDEDKLFMMSLVNDYKKNSTENETLGRTGPRFEQHPLSGGTGVNTGYEQQAGVRTSTHIFSVGSFSEYSEDQCSPLISCFQDNVK
ncbi:hypothetical protein J6590_077773 [Homalodisca vitripennis]|nr:hypothetical protein J6590_077773 [Homalodisca vitripennis]